MPITHRIYHKLRLVIATASGTLTDEDVFGYQRNVWSDPAIAGYNELVDMDDVGHIALPSPDRVRDLANLSATMDQRPGGSKMAVIAAENLAFGLGQMYAARRDMNPQSTKQVEVFRKRGKALEWLGVTEAELEAESVG